MADDVWYTRALPLLEAIADIEVETFMVGVDELAGSVGCTSAEADVEIGRLVDAGFVTGEIDRVMGPGPARLRGFSLAERGSRATGQWPSDDPYDALLELIDRRLADDATDTETRTKLQRFRAAVVDVGKGVAGGVLGSLLRAGLGLP